MRSGARVEQSGTAVIVAARYFPATVADEPTFQTLFRHELRWARTIRNTAPWGFAGSAITYPVPLALVGAAVGLVAGRPLADVIVSRWHWLS